MVDSVDILNFAHGESRPCERAFGSLAVLIDSESIENLSKLHRNPSTTYTTTIDRDAGVRPVVRRDDGVRGTWARTARIRLEPEPENGEAALAVAGTGARLDWDFCMLACFLTGRRVCRPHEIERYRPDVVGDYIVAPHRTLDALETAWQQRTSLVSDKVVPALWNYIWSNDTSEMNIKAMLLSSALNVLYDAAWRETGQALLPKDARKNVVGLLETAVQGCSDLTDAQRSEVLATVRNGVGNVSAPAKIRHLLIRLGVFGSDGDVSDAAWDRIRLFNLIRNAFVHQGRMPELKGVTAERSGDICSVAIGAILPEVVRVDLAQRMGLGADPDVASALADVRNYFTRGEFRAQRVHDESYFEFIERTEREWRETGVLPS